MPSQRRSRAYPAIDLREAVKAVQKLLAFLDSGAQDRDSIARILGYSGGAGGAAVRKIAALSHYGLLRHERGAYSVTQLGEAIGSPPLADFRLRRILRRAFLEVDLFREIAEAYRPSGTLPRTFSADLANLGITDNAKDEVARIFLASAEYAGLITADGFFCDEDGIPSLSPRATPADGPASQDPPEGRVRDNDLTLMFPVTDRKTVELKLPGGLNEEDLKLIRLQIDYLERQIQIARPVPALPWRKSRG